jgi:hypothetical protein
MKKIKTEPCTRCGNPLVVTRATLAAGLSHPSCRYELRALTASGAALDAHALRVWAVRRDLADALRSHGISA